MRFPGSVALLLLAGALAGCGSSDGSSAVAVTGRDDACTPARTELEPGKRTFAFTNRAGEVSELYVLESDGEVVGEVEDVTTGATRNLTVTLEPGKYKLTCKPGQQGDGISTPFTVSGDASAADNAAPDATVAFTAADYEYRGLGMSGVEPGDRVRFEMENAGTVEHEFEVFGPDGKVLGEIGPTASGEKGKVTLELADPGTYRYVCGIDDHEERGMVGTFTLRAPR